MTSQTEASAIVELLDRQAIRDLMAQYARGIDRMDWELVRSCYHHDAHDDHGAYRGDVDGFIDFLASDAVLAGFHCTMHDMGNQHVDLDGDSAHAETYCVAYHRTLPSHPWREADVTIGLRYVDRLEKRDGRWGIVDRVVVHEWARKDPLTEAVDLGVDSEWGRRDRSDLSYRRAGSSATAG